MTLSQRWTLLARPQGVPGISDLVMREVDLPDPADGEIVLENLYISLDPATRRRMDAAQGYLPSIPLGGTPTTTVLGRVVASRHPDYAEGDLALALGGWESHSLIAVNQLTALVDPAASPALSHHLSVLGISGLTAFFGLRDIGRPKPGETVCVSGATGGVGSIAGQIAKILGCRAVGIVGSDDKRQIAIEAPGYDAAVVHAGRSTQALAADLASACPDGIDVQFENVGGAVLDAALLNLNDGGRVALCGLISGYNTTGLDTCTQLWRVVMRSARMEGFLVKSFMHRRAEGVAALTDWVRDGRLKPSEHIVDGLDQAIDAFAMLFDGRNRGKLMLRLHA